MATAKNRAGFLSAPFLPLVMVLSLGSVALALVTQHVFNMQPCAWCNLQRLIYLAIGIVALIAWLRARSSPVRLRRFSVLALLAAALALSGLAAALYQQFVASRTESCAMTLADKIIKGAQLDEMAPWLFKATAFCNEANLPMLGIPYATWSAMLFALLAFLSLRAAWRPARRG